MRLGRLSFVQQSGLDWTSGSQTDVRLNLRPPYFKGLRAAQSRNDTKKNQRAAVSRIVLGAERSEHSPNGESLDRTV